MIPNVSPAALDEMEEGREILKHVHAGLDDMEEGRLVDNADVWSAAGDVIARTARSSSADPLD